MPYATQADLVPLRLSHKQLVQLTDDGSAEVNEVVVNAALEEASGTVDSYCRTRYITPLQQSDVVKARVLDITVYLLYSRKGQTKAGDTVRDRYVDAVKFLEGVSAGRIQLDQPVTAPPQSVGGAPTVSTKPQTFSSRNLRGFN